MSTTKQSQVPLPSGPAGAADQPRDRGRLLVFLGRGRTGKTTAARYIAEEAEAAGKPYILGDGDRTNASLSSNFSNTTRPANTADYEVSRWLDTLIEQLITRGGRVLLDMGGGDSAFLTKCAELGLVSLLAANGIEVCALHCMGAGADDIGVLQVAESDGLFAPERAAIVLNAAFVPVGAEYRAAFRRILEDETYKRAAARGVITLHMPLLSCAEAVEDLRCSFADAERGRAPAGCSPLGPLDRHRVAKFRAEMRAMLASASGWSL